MTTFSPPRRLEAGDDLSGFSSGVALVDEWACSRALHAHGRGTAVVYVTFDDDGAPAGFYSLSAHSVVRDDVKGGWLRRNAPNQILAVFLGMLGVDERFQGCGLGRSLLRDAILRSRDVSRLIGARALLVDPADGAAAAYYGKYGFKPLPGLGRMFLPLT